MSLSVAPRHSTQIGGPLDGISPQRQQQAANRAQRIAMLQRAYAHANAMHGQQITGLIPLHDKMSDDELNRAIQALNRARHNLNIQPPTEQQLKQFERGLSNGNQAQPPTPRTPSQPTPAAQQQTPGKAPLDELHTPQANGLTPLAEARLSSGKPSGQAGGRLVKGPTPFEPPGVTGADGRTEMPMQTSPSTTFISGKYGTGFARNTGTGVSQTGPGPARPASPFDGIPQTPGSAGFVGPVAPPNPFDPMSKDFKGYGGIASQPEPAPGYNPGDVAKAPTADDVFDQEAQIAGADTAGPTTTNQTPATNVPAVSVPTPNSGIKTASGPLDQIPAAMTLAGPAGQIAGFAMQGATPQKMQYGLETESQRLADEKKRNADTLRAAEKQRADLRKAAPKYEPPFDFFSGPVF